MMRPIVSVIMPVYNVEKYVRESLESILSQTFDAMEIIIVDDCGTDASMIIVQDIIENYSGNKQCKIIVNNTNMGIAATRNRGVEVAQGEFIFFIDSDDYLCNRNVIEVMVNRQRETEADVVTANCTMFDNLTGKIYKTIDKDYSDGFYNNSESESDVLLDGVVWNKLIRKSFITQNDISFDEGIVFEDVAWIFKLNGSSPKVATMSLRTYRYRCRPSSIMNTNTVTHIVSRVLLPILCSRWILTHDIRKQSYAVDTIIHFHLGAYLALMNTNNEEYILPVHRLYISEFKRVISNLTNRKANYKLLLLKLPTRLYLWILKWYLRRKGVKNRTTINLPVVENFIDEVKNRIVQIS